MVSYIFTLDIHVMHIIGYVLFTGSGSSLTLMCLKNILVASVLSTECIDSEYAMSVMINCC